MLSQVQELIALIKIQPLQVGYAAISSPTAAAPWPLNSTRRGCSTSTAVLEQQTLACTIRNDFGGDGLPTFPADSHTLAPWPALLRERVSALAAAAPKAAP